MPTGYLPIFPGGTAPDNTGTGNNAAALTYRVSTGTQTANTPKVTELGLLFDAATDEHWTFQFKIPGNYVSGGTLRGEFEMVSATSGNIQMKAGQVSSIAGTTQNTTKVYVAADTTGAVSVPGTAGLSKEFSIPLTTTNMAANREMSLFVGRDADSGNDTASGDLLLTALLFEYTF